MIPDTARALTYTPSSGKIGIVSLPLPRPEVDEVLVRTLFVGLTRKDAEVVGNPAPRLPPGSESIILGHIALGRVEEAGSMVRHLAPGDLVVPMVRRDCGHCIDARGDICLHPDRVSDAGLSGAHGFARDLLVEKGRNLIHVPSEVGELGILLPHLAAVEKAHRDLAECRNRYQFFCYHEEDPTSLPSLITGLGPTGILAAYLLSLHNYRVTVFGRREADDLRARILSPLEVEYINTGRIPISQLAKGEGRFRILFETTGDPTFLASLLSVMGHDSVVALMGATAGPAPVNLDAAPLLRKLVEGNLILMGSTKAGRDAYEAAARQLLEMSDLYHENLAQILDVRFPFEDYARALSINSRRSVLPLLEMG